MVSGFADSVLYSLKDDASRRASAQQGCQVQPSTDHADLTFCALEQGVMLNDSPSGSAVCCAPDEPPLDRRLILDARVEETRRNLAKLLKERADLEHLEQPSAASRGANEKPTRVFLY